MKITTAPFDALYELPPAVPSSPSTLAIVTTLPRSPSTSGCSSMCAIACLHTRNVPVRFTSSTRCHSSRSSRCAGPPPATPAAVTTASSRPCSATVASTAAAIAASSRTSASTNDDVGQRPAALRASCRGSERSRPTTRAPSCTKRATHASPMPDAAPVTSATLPSRLSMRSSSTASRALVLRLPARLGSLDRPA